MFREQTLQLLANSQSTDAQTQRTVQQNLGEWCRIPEFNYTLACIFADPGLVDEMTRSLAGLILKNNCRKLYTKFPHDLRVFIRRKSLELLTDTSHTIRSTAGILIVSVVVAGAVNHWPDLWPTLGDLLSHPSEGVVETSFVTLYRICEDLTDHFARDPFDQLLDEMVPRFFDFCGHTNARIRNYALSCLNLFVGIQAKPVMDNVERYIQTLHSLANDEDKEVKKSVCRSIVSLYENQPSALTPSLDNVILYMINRTQDHDDDIAIEAADFWLTLPESRYGREVLKPYLAQLIPYLMSRMRHTEEDIEMMRADLEDNYMVPDRDVDIRPRFYRGNRSSPPDESGGDTSRASEGEQGEQGGGDEDEDDDDDYDAYSGEGYNMRKCAAGALDTFAHCYGEEILPIIFAELDRVINHDDWTVKEAAVLTIGAIAEGSLSGIVPYLPNLIPYLAQHLSDKHPLVRSITCWAISRYNSWIAQKEQDNYFNLVMESLLRCILDNNKKVQQAACSSFATLVESKGVEILPLTEPILRSLVEAFNKYQHRNLLHLYDAIGTVAETIKHYLNQQTFIDILMPPLINKWNNLTDTDPGLFPLLECLSSVTNALGQGFRPYAEPVFYRGVSLVEQQLQIAVLHDNDPTGNDPPNKDVIIASLDMLSGLTEGLGPDIGVLWQTSQVNVFLYSCMSDSMEEVRQSAFALLGDLARSCYHILDPVELNKMMTLLLQNLVPSAVSVCNNATWALGELALQMKSDMANYTPLVFGPLIANMNQRGAPKTLVDNSTVTIGRIALACPDAVASELNQFVKHWCLNIRSIRDKEAKESAMLGICLLIRKNPSGVKEHFFQFCDAIATFDDSNEELGQHFFEILHSYKDASALQWPAFLDTMPAEMREKLVRLYEI